MHAHGEPDTRSFVVSFPPNCAITIASALPAPARRTRTSAPAADHENAPPDAGRLIERYYADESEWAGQYVIRRIVRARFDRTGDDTIEAHVRYRYRCVPAGCGGIDGYDQRTFSFVRRRDRWAVVRMGRHMSARF